MLPVLKNIKNDKSAGSDGFTGNFYKVFFLEWHWLFFKLCLNYGFSDRKSVAQKQEVITCIPKGNNKEFKKNGFSSLYLMCLIN